MTLLFAISNILEILIEVGFFSCSTRALKAVSLSCQNSNSAIGPVPVGVYKFIRKNRMSSDNGCFTFAKKLSITLIICLSHPITTSSRFAIKAGSPAIFSSLKIKMWERSTIGKSSSSSTCSLTLKSSMHFIKANSLSIKSYILPR